MLLCNKEEIEWLPELPETAEFEELL